MQMLRGHLQASRWAQLFHQQLRSVNYDRSGPRMVGLSLVRTLEKEEEECPFPTLKSLQVETSSEKMHSFNVSCDKVIEFIKLGAINKQISQQYCHYLAHLSRSSKNEEDSLYYARRCSDLSFYILRTTKNMPPMARSHLLADITDVNKDTCKDVCSALLKDEKLDYITSNEFCRLFGACLKYILLNEAQQLLSKATSKMLNHKLCDSLALGLVSVVEAYKSLPADSYEKKLLRSNAIEIIYTVCDACRNKRIQFITKHKDILLKNLRDLNINVTVNANIKMNGRCTSCETHIPLYDAKDVAALNNAIKTQVRRGSDKGLYLNSSPNDVDRFESFLRNIHSLDKKPLDCVIDGLNIAYRAASGYKVLKTKLSESVTRTQRIPRPENQAHTLINTIIRSNMMKEFKKIVVVGKAHMLKWPGLMDFLRKNDIRFYSSFNNSKDDLFQLYASTLSHKTVLVTNDFLRDHLAALEDHERTKLERWIDTHQAWICQKTLRAIWPTPYEKIASVDRKQHCFHLPVIDFNQLEQVGVVDPPPHLSSKSLTWYCCRTTSEFLE